MSTPSTHGHRPNQVVEQCQCERDSIDFFFGTEITITIGRRIETREALVTNENYRTTYLPTYLQTYQKYQCFCFSGEAEDPNSKFTS